MTVAELKAKLDDCDPKQRVFIVLPDDNPLTDGFDIEDVFEISSSTKPGVNAVYIQSN